MTEADLYLDDDGQPLNRLHRAQGRFDRTVDEMLGLLKGILADGELQSIEFEHLANWIAANIEKDHFDRWPFCDLLPRIVNVAQDGMLTDEERLDLVELFQQLTAVDRTTGSPTRIMSIDLERDTLEFRNPSTELPLTRPFPDVTFTGRSFVFTGKFFFGKRIDCQLAVHSRGGMCTDDVTKNTHFLVIGEIGSRDWVHTSFGRKIEKAIQHAKDGRPVAIISEEHWRKFVA